MEPAIVIMEAWKLSKMFSNSKFFHGILLKIHKQPCMEFLEGLLNPCPLLLQLSCLLNNNFIYQISAVCIFFSAGVIWVQMYLGIWWMLNHLIYVNSFFLMKPDYFKFIFGVLKSGIVSAEQFSKKSITAWI